MVSHADEPYMPPKQDKLPPAKLEVIKQWILDGGLKDSGAKAEVSPEGEPLINHGAG